MFIDFSKLRDAGYTVHEEANGITIMPHSSGNDQGEFRDAIYDVMTGHMGSNPMTLALVENTMEEAQAIRVWNAIRGVNGDFWK